MIKSIIALIKGHLVILKHMFKKPVTIEYPEVKPELNENFRGKHVYDAQKCTKCGICVNVCPADAIILEKYKDESGKICLKSYSVDYNKCIFCGNCGFYCPTGAVSMGKDFELATDDRNSLLLNLYDEEVQNNE